MQTKQIRMADWRRELDALSRLYDGAIVSLEIIGGEAGVEEEVHEPPLRGITSDPSGVTVRFEKPGGLRLDHIIAHPQKVRIAESEEGAVMAIEIEDDRECTVSCASADLSVPRSSTLQLNSGQAWRWSSATKRLC